MKNINTSIGFADESKLVNEVMELVQKSDNKTNESKKSKKDAKKQYNSHSKKGNFIKKLAKELEDENFCKNVEIKNTETNV